MDLKEQLKEDLITAMKAKDKLKVSTLRMLNSAIHNAEIAKGEELKEDDISQVVSKEMKRRKEAIEGFKQGGREDLVKKERTELDILKAYMPEQLSEEEITRIVKNVIAETGAEGKKDMGRVMGKVMPQVKGKADGKLVNQIVTKLIG